MYQLLQKVRSHIRHGAVAYLVLMVALVPTLIMYMRFSRNVEAQDQLRFRDRAQMAVDGLQETLDQYGEALRAVSSLFDASDSVMPIEWNRFVAGLDLQHRYPGIRSVGYAPLVMRQDAETFSLRMRGLVGAGLNLSQLGKEPFILPTLYQQQLVGTSERGVGFDNLADPARAAALLELIRTQQPKVSGIHRLGDDSEAAAGFIAYFPVFGRTTPGKPRVVTGVIFSAFVPQRLLLGVEKHRVDPTLSVELYDLLSRSKQPLAVTSNWRNPEAKAFTSIHFINLFDRRFGLRIAATRAFFVQSETHLPRLVLTGGAIFSVLLFAIALTQANARAAAEGLNQQLRASEEKLLKVNADLERKITEQKVTENLLAHERDLLRTLLDHSPDRIYFKDRESRFIKCGKAVMDRLGLSDLSSAVGKTDFDFFAEEHAQSAFEAEQQIMQTGQPIIGVVEKEVWRDGRESWVLTNKMPLRDKHGNIIGTFGTSKEITALKQAEIALEKEKDLLAVTLRSIGDGVITTDTNGRIVLFNKVAELLTGWSQADAVGTPLHDVFQTVPADQGDDSDTELVRRAITGTDVVVQERRSLLFAHDGVERHISHSVAPIVDREGNTIGAVLVFRDITEKLKTEAELQRASKLESIGVLAGGIAHDFNNILTVVLGNISLARMLNDGMPKQVVDLLGEAEKASLRARDLTQRLLTFAKGGAPIKRTVQPGPLLRDCTKAVLQGTPVDYKYFIDDELWSVNADEGQLAQVFHNLVQYARHAAAAEHPTIDVHASNQEIARDPLLFLEPGKYVRVSIRHHGPGLQPEQLNKIFDPYFSSRKQGGGLELATAYSIVRKHDGQIRVESVSGQGTVFHVYLPASRLAPQPVEKPKREARPAAHGRILVMDDEAPIRQLASVLLKRIGYTPDVAADGAEAIAKYTEALKTGVPYAAVIMDLTIPNGMGGAEAVRRLRAVDPSVRAIVSSGYSNDPVMANFREYGFSGVVPKPYSADDLATALGDLVCDETLPCESARVVHA